MADLSDHGRAGPGPQLERSTPAVVLKLVPDPLAHGGLMVARSLGRAGVSVHAVHDHGWVPARRSRYVTSSLAVGPGPSPTDVVDALTSLAHRLPERPVLIPVDDMASLLVDDSAGALGPLYRFPRQPPGLARQLADKGALARLCQQHGVASPTTLRPAHADDLDRFAAEHGFPVMVKASDPTRLDRASGDVSVAVARDADELHRLLVTDGGEVRANYLLQEYIPGGSQAVWMFNGYFGEDGRCLAGFTGFKIRQHPPGLGPTTLGECQPNQAVAREAVTLLEAVGYRGIVDLGLRFDERDGRYKLLDVNPRLGSTFRLFVTPGGLDVVRALHLDMTGRPVPSGEARPGRRWVVESWDPATWPAYHRLDRRGVSGLVQSFRGVEEGAWFATDDLLPFAAMAGRRAAAAAQRAGRARPHAHESDATIRPASASTYFDERAQWWADVYRDAGVEGEVYRGRRARVVEAVTRLGLPPAATVVEVGCGAGSLAGEFARRGFRVVAVDRSEPMLRRAGRGWPEGTGTGSAVAVLADAAGLPIATAKADAVVAVGLLPWLTDPAPAVREMAAAVRPGGRLVLTADNAARLTHKLDPRLNRSLEDARSALKRVLWRRTTGGASGGPGGPPHRYDRPEAVARLVGTAGLEIEAVETYGFGPFSFLGRPIATGAAGARLHRALQRAADRGRWRLGGAGSHLLVVARRPDGQRPTASS